MKKVIKLTENDLHKIVKESINKILNESKDVENKIIQQCSHYKNILMKEFSEAQKAVVNSNSTFHNGIAPSLRSKGYTVIGNGDNWVSFYSPSRLFEFYACSFGEPWKLTTRIMMEFSNYTWKELYQYPCYYHTKDYKKFRLNDFEKLYMQMSNEIGEPVIIEHGKVTSEKIDTYNTFTVYRGGGRSFEEIQEFDNFEDAKKCAYEYAKEECERGRNLKDSTSRYYNTSPRDITTHHSDYAVTYEFYDYDEHSYYYCVVADKK